MIDDVVAAEPRLFLDGRVTLHAGDCLAVLRTFGESSVDSVVTDPPYHLTSIVKRFSRQAASPARSNFEQPADKNIEGILAGSFKRLAKGFMGQTWDGGDIAFQPELWAEVLRVLKPGGHVLAFSATRTYHRMACAIDDAGFEIRDMTAWLYGSGFPKSHDVSKGLDKADGFWRGRAKSANVAMAGLNYERSDKGDPITDLAKQWQGWGTALKPALEPICLARKPLVGTVAANVLAHGTGALNIEGCRVEGDPVPVFSYRGESSKGIYGDGLVGSNRTGETANRGRWPANVVHDGSDEVLAAFPDSGGGGDIHKRSSPKTSGVYGAFTGDDDRWVGYGDSGSAARFFYSAKADADDRIGSKHPTVKPVDLMRWLVRLVTPPGGTVLDPFAGTGTTGEAAWREGLRAVLIEREAPYRDDIARRMALCRAGPDERKRESLKARHAGAAVDHGPLFAREAVE